MCFSTAAGSRPVQPATTACSIATSLGRVLDLVCNVRERIRGGTARSDHWARTWGLRRTLRTGGATERLRLSQALIGPSFDRSLTLPFQLHEMAGQIRRSR